MNYSKLKFNGELPRSWRGSGWGSFRLSDIFSATLTSFINGCCSCRFRWIIGAHTMRTDSFVAWLNAGSSLLLLVAIRCGRAVRWWWCQISVCNPILILSREWIIFQILTRYFWRRIRLESIRCIWRDNTWWFRIKVIIFRVVIFTNCRQRRRVERRCSRSSIWRRWCPKVIEGWRQCPIVRRRTN